MPRETSERRAHLDQAAALGVGTIIGGRYRLLRRLGSGGFATVFEAGDVREGGRVALKLLDLRLDAELRQTFEQRFAREAQAIASLCHHNLVRLIDHGFAGELHVPYIAMELLHGRELECELLEHGPMAPARALRLFRGALEGLAVAHARGIVHRDLKPLNLFVRERSDADGDHDDLVVLDFGIAHVSAAQRLTSTGELMGTPQYLAPEWIRHQHVSPALDVYQMGLILIEMLAGVPAIQADSAYDCMVAHCQQDFRVPGALLHSPIGPVLAQALALDPELRFADAAAFARALASIDPAELPDLSLGADAPIDAATPEPPRRLSRPSQRKTLPTPRPLHMLALTRLRPAPAPTLRVTSVLLALAVLLLSLGTGFGVLSLTMGTGSADTAAEAQGAPQLASSSVVAPPDAAAAAPAAPTPAPRPAPRLHLDATPLGRAVAHGALQGARSRATPPPPRAAVERLPKSPPGARSARPLLAP